VVFICIKDFNVQTITSLKLNLFYFFIYCCQYHERKTTCLDIFLLSDRQWGTEHQYLLSRFLGVSILQLLIIYRSAWLFSVANPCTSTWSQWHSLKFDESVIKQRYSKYMMELEAHTPEPASLTWLFIHGVCSMFNEI